MPAIVRVTYHQESVGWWADSDDLPGFVASGADLHEVRDLVRSGVPFYLENDDVVIEEQTDTGALVVQATWQVSGVPTPSAGIPIPTLGHRVAVRGRVAV